MKEVFRKYRPEVVLHAAACRHVPMLEKQPWEAVSNNILGSQVVMEMAIQYGAKILYWCPRTKQCGPPMSWAP